MYELTYEEFKKHASGSFGSFDDRKLIKFVKEYVPLDKGYIFYPRHFYLASKNTELIFFKRNEVISIKEQEREVKVRFIKVDRVKNIEFTTGHNEWEKVNLVLALSDGEVIELDSKKDSSEDYVSLYNQIIGKVLKEMMK